MRMRANIFFNTQHSPIGAFASFTLGYPGASGGLGLEIGAPANENIYIGVETRAGGRYQALPFFRGAEDAARRFDVAGREKKKTPARLTPFPRSAIRRDFKLADDTWRAGDLTFRIISPLGPVPDPARASADQLRAAIVPSVLVELTVNNTRGARTRTAFFAYQGSDPAAGMRRLDDPAGGLFIGVGQGLRTALACREAKAVSALGHDLEQILQARSAAERQFGLGGVGALLFRVPPRKKKTFRIAVCFYRGGMVTANRPAQYAYARHFHNIEAVCAFTLDRFAALKKRALDCAAGFRLARLSPDRRFMLAQAIQSYYGSTQLLDCGERPCWVVNEGEYRMMNTFDLAADQLFFELRMNPWTVRNVLDGYARHWKYTDTVRLPGETAAAPGGIGFTHDMGVANVFAAPGTSAYEQPGRNGCFSFMTHEQLVNWICCAWGYQHYTGDRRWLRARRGLLRQCLASLQNRDHPDPTRRDGVMDADSARCQGGGEITTYDSLDPALGQARRNLYLAVKTWAAYLGLEHMFGELNEPRRAATAAAQAARAAATIRAQARADGSIPAILGANADRGIIPAIEGLVFPFVFGMRNRLRPRDRFGPLMAALRRHLQAVLQPGRCLFPDGAWKISATSDNSWLSKIYLCQFVARDILGLRGPAIGARADRAHAAWLRDPRNAYYAWSDQMVAGIARGSRYYPRGVTAVLWTEHR